MPQLPITPESLSTWTRTSIAARRYRSRATKAVMRSHHLKIPVYDVPLRFRPWFVLFTSLVMITLAFLGFTNFAHALPINDKLLHFFCLMLATGIFYFIFDVEEDAKRIWFWRYAPLISTGIVCFFFGGVLSEVVQSLLPYKEFQMGDVIANLLGSSLGLYIAYHLERYYRHRREISRLYRPLNPHEVLLSDDEDYDLGPLLPTHTTTHTRTTNTVHPAITSNNGTNGNNGGNNGGGGKGKSRLGNVWDESEELFDIGGDSDADEEEMSARTPAGRFERRSKNSPPSR